MGIYGNLSFYGCKFKKKMLCTICTHRGGDAKTLSTSACAKAPVITLSCVYTTSWNFRYLVFLLGEVNTSLTGLYDMLVHMSEELEAMRQRQLATEKELNATREVLRIGILPSTNEVFTPVCLFLGWWMCGFPACIIVHMTRGSASRRLCIQGSLHPGEVFIQEGVCMQRRSASASVTVTTKRRESSRRHVTEGTRLRW